MKIAIIGAGVAGMFVAGLLKNSDVTLFERNLKPGVKLNITGKGRCNLTNNCSEQEFLENVVSNPRFLYSAINAFSPADCIEYFTKNGVELVTERGRRVFPVSNKAKDVTNCLYSLCKRNGVKLLNAKVDGIKRNENGFSVFYNNISDVFDKVVICTGGKSYPETGSDGDGYCFARSLGHKIVDVKPALVPIETREDVSSLANLNLKNVSVSAVCGKKIHSLFGEAEFFKKGLCGPTVLSLSSLINKYDPQSVKIILDLKPALGNDALDKRVQRELAKPANKTVTDVLKTLLPQQMIEYFLKYCKVNGEIRTVQLTKEQRRNIVISLKNMTFTVKKLSDVSRGIVTAGGVDVKEINPKTMESKLVSGLYFAGEIIDVDALTGGYNIQIALSTAFLVASAIEN